jgi:hypothetical protein
MAYFQTGDYRRAAEFAAKASVPRPDHVYPHLMMAASYGLDGRVDAARDASSRIARLVPDFTLAKAEKVCVYLDPEDRKRFLEGLRKAGVPE